MRFKTVSEYLGVLPTKNSKILRGYIKLVQKIIPNLTPEISYQIIGFKYRNKPLLYFASFTNHMSLYPLNLGLKEKFKKKLTKHTIKGYTLQFTNEVPLASNTLIDMIKYRKMTIDDMEENFWIRLSAPAQRALRSAGIKNLNDFENYSKNELLCMHGFGPSSLKIIKTMLKNNKLLLKPR